LAVKKSTNTSTVKQTKQQRSAWSKVTTIGIDLGDRYSYYCAIDDAGETVFEGRVATTAGGFQLQFGGVGPKTIAVETGTHSPWVSRLLSSLGHEVIVANSRKLRLIYENRTKSDRVDAESLARIARLDRKLLCEVQHRSEAAQADLALLRSRDAIVATRTRLISHVRGSVKSLGVRLPASSSNGFQKNVSGAIPQSVRAVLLPLVDLIAQLTKQIKAFDRRAERLIRDSYPQAQRLLQVRGVGPITALAFILTLEDHRRFRRSRSVGPFIGLVPAREDSGQSRPQKRISKQGDAFLRRLLVGCAHYIMGPFGVDCDLRRHGLAMAARGGKNAKKRAAVAVARKLGVLLHRLWSSEDDYDPLFNAKQHQLVA
jgi:transposase